MHSVVDVGKGPKQLSDRLDAGHYRTHCTVLESRSSRVWVDTDWTLTGPTSSTLANGAATTTATHSQRKREVKMQKPTRRVPTRLLDPTAALWRGWAAVRVRAAPCFVLRRGGRPH